MSAGRGFVPVTDVEGKRHVIRCAAITSVVTVARVDGHSSSPGGIVRLQDATAIRVYENERAALEAALLTDRQEDDHEP